MRDFQAGNDKYSSIALMLDALQVMDTRLRQIAGGNGSQTKCS